MRDFQHISRPVRSPLSVGRVDATPLFGRDSMVGIHWTCAKTAVYATAKTWEGDSNTENEVASA
jgi:hypothetical protein